MTSEGPTVTPERPEDDLALIARRWAELDAHYRNALRSGGGSAAASSVLQSVLSAAEIDIGWLASLGQDGRLSVTAVLGGTTGELEDLAIRGGAGLTGKVFLSGKPEWIDRYLSSDRITHEFDHIIAGEGVMRLLAVPILRGGRVTGVLTAGGRHDGMFGDRALELALGAARSLALAEEVAERERRTAEAAAQEERRRLALDLHDSLGAMLYAIGSDARGLREEVAGDPELLTRVDRLSDRTSEAATLLREALRALHASPTELKLGANLQAECRAFENRSGVRSHVMMLTDFPLIPHPLLTLVLRAFREALHNVEKHARASAVVVTASAADGRLNLVVADDGAGVRRNGVPTGLGLAQWIRAVESLGGRLTLSDGADGGAVWRLMLPLGPSNLVAEGNA